MSLDPIRDGKGNIIHKEDGTPRYRRVRKFLYICPLGCFTTSNYNEGYFLFSSALRDHLIEKHTKEDLAFIIAEFKAIEPEELCYPPKPSDFGGQVEE